MQAYIQAQLGLPQLASYVLQHYTHAGGTSIDASICQWEVRTIYIKWTHLADLPVPLYNACAAIQGKKQCIVGGDGPIKDAGNKCMFTMLMLMLTNGVSRHYQAITIYDDIPHIISGKLAIIGRRRLIKYPL